ncbi:cytochrome c [Neobacillus sp. YX16]|uniref:c-type cytochrome n=1 Tax=Neobacillus sp. YX16 TaxID=3047874 RepID=UPI0024C2940F|nr:cytochrome c [Neobacillus sp. YX16]WHZ00801.1 cytochrome c [Neobacillus sp. YX16]
MKKLLATSGINILLAGCLVFLLFYYEGPEHAAKAGGKTAGGETASIEKAEEIASTSCMTCHGENLKGGAGPALDKIGSKYAQNDIENIIKNGKGAMPGGVITPDEAKIVAEWLVQKK